MTKAEIVSRMAEQAGISKRAANRALKGFVKAIRTSLASEKGKIRVPDLGTFRVVTTRTYIGRNPRTRQRIRIHSKRVPRFSPAKVLRTVVKSG